MVGRYLGRAMEVVAADPSGQGRFADRQAVSDDGRRHTLIHFASGWPQKDSSPGTRCSRMVYENPVGQDRHCMEPVTWVRRGNFLDS
jgi:hypothetical protein